MIMNNENKKLSRNRKKRSGRKITMDGKMKSQFNKLKSEEKTKGENFDR